MLRPTVRPDPEAPRLSADSIINLAEQHFIQDRAPCGRSEHGNCNYSGPNGCFVGMFLTEKDAELVGRGSITCLLDRPEARDILDAYFCMDRRTLAVLCIGQREHDEKWGTTTEDADMEKRKATFALLRSMIA